MQNKWQLFRAGLFNFWYYDEEEYNFADGKLLLRGSNGSGKSVTMQSFIPVLLDGKKSPDRLDPFGSRARRMEDYLLGEKEVVERDERTGYLYLEYKRENSEQYLTTGIGLRAKRYSNLEFWGFVLLDNRRIGKDFHLYKTEYSVENGEEQKIPLTRRELENRLETGGKVVRTQSEYMELVNKHIFGFESLEAYDDLIKLLIQLRSPKLSKDFKPTVIYDILNDSLPPLSDEELRPLSDTIENMDQTKQQIDQLKRDQQSLQRLIKQYDLYNQYVLVEKAVGLQKAEQRQSKLQVRKEEALRKRTKNEKVDQENRKRIQTLIGEQEVLQEEERQLREHDVFRAQEEKRKTEEQMQITKGKWAKKEENLQIKQQQERKIEWERTQLREKQYLTGKQLEEHLDELEFLAGEAYFDDQHRVAEQDFKKKYEQHFDFVLWNKETAEYESKINSILKVLRKRDQVYERYEEVDKELGESRKKLDIKQREETKWNQLFEEEKEKLLESFYQWVKQNQVLTLTEQQIRQTAQQMITLYEPYRYEELKTPSREAYNQHDAQLREQIFTIEQERKAKVKEVEEKLNRLKEWKEKKELEPPRHAYTESVRVDLEQRNIPYLPFYSAVEFQQYVSTAERDRIEAAITQMGLLDALIVPSAYQQEVKDMDKVLVPQPHLFAHTLADYLYPTPVKGVEITAEEIDQVLRSILIDQQEEGSTYLTENGCYQIGLLQGYAPPEMESIYIGMESRWQYRERMITQLETELEELEQQKKKLEETEAIYRRKKEQLEKEYALFPEDIDTRAAFEELEAVKRRKKDLAIEVEEKNEKLKQIAEELQQIRNQLREKTEHLAIPVSEEGYEGAQESIQTYRQELQKLQLTYKDFLSQNQQLQHFEELLEDIQREVDELKGECSTLQAEWEKLSFKLDSINKRLQELGADEILAKIEQTVKRLLEIPEEVQALRDECIRIEKDMETLAREIKETEEELQISEQLYQQWQEVFYAEYRLQFVKQIQAETALPLEKLGDQDQAPALLAVAEHVINTLGSLLEQTQLDREKLTSRLNEAFHKENGILVEYRLTQEHVMEVTQLPTIKENEILQNLVEQLQQKSRRIQLLMEYNGKRVSPYYVMEHIEEDIKLQESILSQKDRELYEEIIMNNVGKIIRARINRAEGWVKKINELMETRNTSSGLTFSIRWKPKTADVEEELDTKELVDLLRADARILKDEDFNQVTQHFRSKIDRAKETLIEKGYGESLHQAIKEILDYRKWFSFTLFYRREGEQKKELTDKVFFTFSGGEKAMAMYIPLFSAAYSRYLEARADAPYIITLDEAFAGVDENNIREMFDIVEELGFNYIMNSQAIWGDYDTVQSLSIAELVRPKNAPYVTVVRYHWDGKVRHLLYKESHMEEESDGALADQAEMDEKMKEDEVYEQFT